MNSEELNIIYEPFTTLEEQKKAEEKIRLEIEGQEEEEDVLESEHRVQDKIKIASSEIEEVMKKLR